MSRDAIGPQDDLPLAQFNFGARRRPAIVPVIGVISVVFACLTGLGNVGVGRYAIDRYLGLKAPPPVSSATFHYIEPDTTQPAAIPSVPMVIDGNPALTGAEVGLVIARIQRMAPTPLNAAQIATISRELQRPGQRLLWPGMAHWPVQALAVDPPTGEMQILFSDGNQARGGEMNIAKDGSLDFATGRSGALGYAPWIGPSAVPRPSPLSAVWLGIDAALGVLLAIYLLVIGILLLCRDRAANRTRHLRYAWMKLLLSAFGAAALVNLDGLTSTATAIVFVGPLMLYFGAPLLAGGSYPIVLFIAMNWPSVKAWFATSPATGLRAGRTRSR